MGVSIDQYRGRIGRFALQLCSGPSGTKKQEGQVHAKQEFQDFWTISGWTISLLCVLAIFVSKTTFYSPPLSELVPGDQVENTLLVTCTTAQYFPNQLVLLCSGDVERNPGPSSQASNAGDSNDESTDSLFGPEFEQETYYDPAHELKVGDAFSSRDAVIEKMKTYCDRKFTPLIRVSNRAGDLPNLIYGRIVYKCTHGHTRKSKATSDRPFQKVNFTGCPAVININQNKDGDWKGTKMESNHQGHVMNRENYFSYPHVRKLNKDDLDYVEVSL